ncbi:hypothetical protein [Butyrivibrio sp. NC2002]|uniref:hypothetical protein n=1 Tax=Butyrivibrio sp. NC2002 TaxID=1410610 RepID=UPI00056B2BCE|nr:hypothetical protein [Butyrivibrio sp. NC2002]
MRKSNENLRKRIKKKLKIWHEIYSEGSKDPGRFWRKKLKDNFEYMIDNYGFNGLLFAESLETDPKNFSKMKNYGRALTPEKLSRLIYVDDINILWLITGDDRFSKRLELSTDDDFMTSSVKCQEFILSYRNLKNEKDKRRILNYLMKELAEDSDTLDDEDSEL